MKYLNGALFAVIFALVYLVLTHYVLHRYTEGITQLNFGLVIGALFWIILNLNNKE